MATKTAPTKVVAMHFVKPTAVACAKVLPTPPVMDTLAGRTDLEAALQMQARQTPELVARAKVIEKNDAFIFNGVHFPSDLVGGWKIAEAFVAELKQSEAFRAQLEKCRVEVPMFARK